MIANMLGDPLLENPYEPPVQSRNHKILSWCLRLVIFTALLAALYLVFKSLGLSIQSTLFNLGLAGIGIAVAIRPPTTFKERFTYWMIFAVIFIASVFNSHFQEKEQKNTERQNTEKISSLIGQINILTNQINILTNQIAASDERHANQIHELIVEFSTNSAISSAVRTAVLNDELQKTADEGNNLKKDHLKMEEQNMPDIASLRVERQNELSQRENQKKQAEIQRQLDILSAEKQAAQDSNNAAAQAVLDDQNKQAADREFLQSEKVLTQQMLPIFDRAIGGLNKLLERLSIQTGQKIYSDFSSTTPSAYGSNLIKDGIFVRGINSISISTNQAWSFRIRTLIRPILENPTGQLIALGYHTYLGFSGPFATLRITAKSTNGVSILEIAPYRQTWYAYMSTDLPPMAQNEPSYFQKISIILNVPNGLSSTNIVDATDCMKDIDKAVRGLVAAQDQASPLSQ